MDGVTAVTSTVTSSAQTSANVVKKASSDVIQLQFYKNPVFIAFTIYTISLFSYYASMSEDVKNRYVFSNKFRENGSIYWKYIVTYPYDSSKSTSSFIYSIITPPIILYLFFYTTFVSSFVDTTLPNYQAYFYSLMFSFFILAALFTVHVIIFKFILKPENRDVELVLGDQSKSEKSYESFYRTQWVLLTFLSPIYVCIATYIIRKL